MNNTDFRIEGDTLTGYFGDRTVDIVTVPENVLALRKYCLSNIDCKEINLPSNISFLNPSLIYNCTFLETVRIGKNASIINPDFLEACPNIKEILISDDNPNFTSVDGFLLTKDKSELVMCPESISGNVVVPEGIKRLDLSIFSKCKNITSLILPSSLEQLKLVHLPNCPKLEKIVVRENVSSINEDYFRPATDRKEWTYKGTPKIIINEENDFYKEFDGVLYNIVENRLIYVSDKKENDLIIPSFIKEINNGALKYKNITGLTVPFGAHFDDHDDYPVDGTNNIERVDFKDRNYKIPRDLAIKRSLLKNIFPGQLEHSTCCSVKDDVIKYMLHDSDVTEEWKKSWCNYFVDNVEEFSKKIMEKTSVLRLILKYIKLDLNQIQHLLTATRNSESVNLLLEYKKKNYNSMNILDELEKDLFASLSDN